MTFELQQGLQGFSDDDFLSDEFGPEKLMKKQTCGAEKRGRCSVRQKAVNIAELRELEDQEQELCRIPGSILSYSR